MSTVVYVFGGILAYLGLLGVLTLSMTLAARQAARWVGVAEFRWFRELPVAVAWWRLLAVRLVAAVAPVAVTIVLSWASFVIGGIPILSTRVVVLAGAARQAGMRDGDRIVSIDGEGIARWEQVREVTQRKQGTIPVQVERAGKLVELTVTPQAGRLGVAASNETEKVGPLSALDRGIKLPFTVVGATASAFMHVATGREKPDLRGPVGVVHETSVAEQQGSTLRWLALLASYLWPFLAGIPFFDAAASWMFREMNPQGAYSGLRGWRLERLRLALLLAASGYLTVTVAAALTSAGVPASVVLMIWAMPSATATYPLLWIAGNEVWGRGIVLGALGLALFVPCLPLLILLALLRDLGSALRNEGFRVSWFRSEPFPR